MESLKVALDLLTKLVPTLTSSSQLQYIIDLLVALIPFVVQEFIDVLPMLKNIIAALTNHDAITTEQMATLKAMDKEVDDAFDAADASTE